MSAQKCNACSWCFPICCCTNDQLHIPLAILACFLIFSGVNTLSDLNSASELLELLDDAIVFGLWAYAIFNVASPASFLISLCLNNPEQLQLKKILVLIYFANLVIDAILVGLVMLFVLFWAISFDAADCGNDSTDTYDWDSLCDSIASFLYIVTIILLLDTLVYVNWAGATWFHYANNVNVIQQQPLTAVVMTTTTQQQPGTTTGV